MNGGLNCFDRETETFTRYQHDPNDPTSLSDNTVRALYEDNEGTLWVGTAQGGLNRFDRETGTFTRYQADPEDEHSLVNNLVRSISEDSHGRFWVGTAGDGLHTMDRETGTFTGYPNDPDNPDALSRPYIQGLSLVPTDWGVSFVHEDKKGKLWIGAYQGGFIHYDPETETLLRFEFDPSNPDHPPSNDVWTLFESIDGTIWIGTFTGVCKVVSTESRIDYHYAVPSNDNSLSHKDVRYLYQDGEGKIWIATYGGGLNRYDPVAGTYTHFKNIPGNPNSLSSDTLLSVTGDMSDRL